jgi:hypothetical protein
MCAAFKLGSEGDCNFKQMAVSESPPGTVDSHGFNLPENSTRPDSYVVIFHLSPLVGNFFVVSPEGILKASYYRAKGEDYTEIPNECPPSFCRSSCILGAEFAQPQRPDSSRGYARAPVGLRMKCLRLLSSATLTEQSTFDCDEQHGLRSCFMRCPRWSSADLPGPPARFEPPRRPHSLS